MKLIFKIDKKTHIGVYGVVVKNHNILLINKTRGPYKGKLDLPGGKIEHGENITECLSRELAEETGVQVQGAELLKNSTYKINFKDGEKIISMHHIGLIYKIINTMT